MIFGNDDENVDEMSKRVKNLSKFLMIFRGCGVGDRVESRVSSQMQANLSIQE